MHLKVRHEIRCRFDAPARNLVSILRISPRSHEGQHVSDWYIDSDIDCSLRAGSDAFGNLTQTFSARGPIQAITIAAVGSIDTFDTAGVTRGAAERMPLDVFLRDTALTGADAAVRRFADEIGAAEIESLGRLHALMDKVNASLALDRTSPSLPAAAALGQKSAGPEGFAHIFIAAARHLGIPSRYVAGYLVEDGNALCHGWAEAHVPGLGWTAFDPVSNLCPEGAHVRVAAGFDALGASFMRGVDPARSVHDLTITVAG